MKIETLPIVCATDFSDNARAASRVAAAIARRRGAQLLLVHVADEPGGHRTDTAQFRALIRRARDRLRAEAAHLRSPRVSIKTKVLHGDWAEQAVTRLVHQVSAQLVVVSSVSKTKFERWTLGSVAAHIARLAPIPTLVVRRAEGLLAWAETQRPLRVMLAADFSASSDAAAAWLATLRQIGPCEIHVAHVSWPEKESFPVGTTQRPVRSVSSSEQKPLTRDLQRRIAPVLGDVAAFHVEGNWGRPDAALVRLALAADVDLVVLGNHQRSGAQRIISPSVSQGVLRHATMSVASVPSGAGETAGAPPVIERVLVATDFSPAGNSAVRWSHALLAGGGHLKLVHVAATASAASKAGQKLAVLATPEMPGVSIETEVLVDSDAARAITAAARKFGADVICVGSRGRSRLSETFVGSVARSVVAGSPQPVFLVRPPKP